LEVAWISMSLHKLLGDELPAAIFFDCNQHQSTNRPESALRCCIQRLLVCSCFAEKGPTAKRPTSLLSNNKRLVLDSFSYSLTPKMKQKAISAEHDKADFCFLFHPVHF
jgi:hypothetical protein